MIRTLGTGYWTPGTGHWALGTGLQAPGTGYWTLDSGLWTQLKNLTPALGIKHQAPYYNFFGGKANE